MTIRPMHDNLLVEVEKESSNFQGSSLIKPEDVHEDIYAWGRVKAVGPGRWSTPKPGKPSRRIPMEVQVGDRVSFIKFLQRTQSGEAIRKHLSEDEFLIQEKDIIGVEEKESTEYPS